MDTQWPRYEVFEQERPEAPHRNAGAVHATDAELALQNARDVFARRPDCYSLWVAPASQIFSRTDEEMAADPSWRYKTAPLSDPLVKYQVFQKLSQRQSQTYVTHVGQVEARSPAEALRQAVAQFNSLPVFVWWLIPDQAITRTAPEEAGSLFSPALDKPFRQPSYYRTLTQMREVKSSDAPPGDPQPPGQDE